MILLAAGLLLGCKGWAQVNGMMDQTAADQERRDFIRSSGILSSRGVIPAEMRPFLFLPVPLNSADRQLLETIPGIGPHLAERIIALRSARKEFHDIAELLDVEGIGPQKYAAIKGFCSL